MKNTSLALFATLILLGWTSLAAGVIAVFAGQPDMSMKIRPQEPAHEAPALFSDSEGPCPKQPEPPDASVPCSA